MAVLADIVRNVLVIIIIASFLELLLPIGSTRPFVRFAIGLFVLIAVLNPVLSFLFDNKEFSISLWDYQADEILNEAIEEEGREINQKIAALSQAQYTEKITGQISSVALLVPGVEKAEAKADMEVNGVINYIKLTITLEKDDKDKTGQSISVLRDDLFNAEAELELKNNAQRKITEVISNMYGINSEQIEIEFEGG